MQGGSTEPQSDAGWQFVPEESPASSGQTIQQLEAKYAESVSWTASEFLAHQKTFGWYAALMFVGFLVAGVVYFLTRDYISTGVVVFASVIMGILGARKPRVLSYKLDGKGLTIEDKFHPYGDFKSFSIIQEQEAKSIALMPLKRFMPLLIIYFDPKDEERVAQVLASHLPVEAHKLDTVDRLMSKIRF